MPDKQARPNFFLLLGLDPDAKWDQALYERTLREKRNQWARQSSMELGAAAIAAKRNLNLLDELRQVMEDKQLRKQEQAAARRDLAARTNKLRAALKRRLEIMMKKGFVWASELEALAVDYPSYAELLAGEAIGDQLARIEKRPRPAQTARPARLDAAKAANIGRNLEVLGMETLYDVLREVDGDITPASGLPALGRAADELYRQANQTMRKTPEVGAKQELAGLAKVVFSSEDGRRRYDTTRRLAPVDRLIREYEHALESVKAFDVRQVEQFLLEARKQGFASDEARGELVDYFSEKKWAVDLPSAAAEAALNQHVPCRRCQTLNEPGTEFCTECGEPLKCPNCRASVPAGAGSCGACGFQVGSRDYVVMLVEQCEVRLRARRLDEATTELGRARSLWTLPASSNDDLAVRIRRCEVELERLLREERQEADAIAGLMTARQYRTALRRLRATSEGFPGREQLLATAGEQAARADELLDQARGSVPYHRAELYAQVLRVCADDDEARTALRRLPPPRPTEVRASVRRAGDTVRVSWQPSQAGDLRYVVVRRRGAAPPAAIEEGEQLATVAGLSYDDRQPEVGASLWYAVFAERDGFLSAPAVAPEPVFLTREAEVTSQRVDDGEIELTWTLPANAVGMEVWREESGQEPATRTRITLEAQTRLHDRRLRNGASYRYTLVARFMAEDGRPLRSSGTTVELAPGPKPDPLRELFVTSSDERSYFGRKVELRWPDAAGRTVKVLKLRPGQRPSLRLGDVVPEHALAEHGRVISGAPPLVDHLFDPGGYHFVPVVVAGGLAYVGEARRYAYTDEVGGLTARNRSRAVRLQWSWPPDCQEVLVALGDSGRPSDPTAAPHQVRVGRREYERTGWYDLLGAEEGELGILVAVVKVEQGMDFVSSGAFVSARLRPIPQLEYELRHAWWPQKTSRLVLSARQTVQLPALRLVGRSGSPPADRDDGQIVHRLPPLLLQRQQTIPLAGAPKPLFCRLFVEDEADEEDIEIIHPAPERACLR